MGFAAVTRFGPEANIPTDFDGSDLEQQMRKIWRQGNTLKERFITRMEILGICERYNKARARYFGASASSVAFDAAAKKAKDQADQAVANRSAGMSAGSFLALTPSAQNYARTGISGSSPSSLLEAMAVNQLMSASARSAIPDYSKANQDSKFAAAQSAAAATAGIEVKEYIAKLAKLGFKLRDSGAYPIIPPMNLRREIAVELNSNPTPSTLTNTPSLERNTPPPERSQ